MQKLIGILGGTFDPVHYGHLKPAHEIYQRLHLDDLRLVPCSNPVHREAPSASAEQRLRMLQLALQEYPQFTVDDREIRRRGRSYTVDTLSELRQEFPDAVLCLLLGLDALEGFKQWHRWRQILKMAHLLVSPRPGYGMDPKSERAKLIAEFGVTSEAALYDRPGGAILLVATGQYDISSTVIRQRVRDHQTLSGLVPPGVASWIKEHRIYEVN
ncbi:MAG TPA: nicotinate-nucleotide adenylyltransferase [Gammaproteobacteria bacterium]